MDRENESAAKHFFEKLWEQRPASDCGLENPFHHDLVFDALVEAAETFRRGETLPGGGFLRGYIAEDTGHAIDASAPDDVLDFLPTRDDGGFEQWFAERQPPFLLHLTHLHLFHDEIARRVRAFLRPLIPMIGIPTGMLWVDCFIGAYDRTPVGVHYDGNSLFGFGLMGRKAIHLWEPADYWRTRQRLGGRPFQLPRDGEARRRVLDGATTIEAEAGSTFYWPARLWHVAEPLGGRDEPTVTLNITYAFRPLDSWTDEAPPDDGRRVQRLRPHTPHRIMPVDSRLGLEGGIADSLHRRVGPAVDEALAQVGPVLDSRPREAVFPELGPDGALVLPAALEDWCQRVESWSQRVQERAVRELLQLAAQAGVGASEAAEPIVWGEHGSHLFLATPTRCLILVADSDSRAFARSVVAGDAAPEATLRDGQNRSLSPAEALRALLPEE